MRNYEKEMRYLFTIYLTKGIAERFSKLKNKSKYVQKLLLEKWKKK